MLKVTQKEWKALISIFKGRVPKNHKFIDRLVNRGLISSTSAHNLTALGLAVLLAANYRA